MNEKHLFSISTKFDDVSPNGRFEIIDCGTKGYCSVAGEPIVWKRDAKTKDEMFGFYPDDVRAKYEEICERPEFAPSEPETSPANLVEMIADEEECAFDQSCAYGHRVEDHAVYCHNEGWLYAPGKCRRTWYTGGEVRDEDCRGFKPNPRLEKVREGLKKP